MESIIDFVKQTSSRIKFKIYRRIYIPIRAKQMRLKDKITVVFVVADIGAWKTEYLYNSMLNHPRFNSILIIGKNSEENDVENIRFYCDTKGYQYIEIDNLDGSLWNQFHPDIIFYQKPYCTEFSHNLKSLFCYAPYAFHNSIENWAFKTALIYNCWQVYYENKTLRNFYTSRLGRRVHNGYATGIPPMDELATPKENLEDTWKDKSGKVRIIYAPHHSINPDNWWKSSTFLTTGEIMLELAKKYSDRVQWAFKPHPLLRYKLNKIWEKEKTDAYYAEWENASWSQYESGKYLGLFKYSDAMIHDCGSFIEEYHVTGNPVMFLIDPQNEDKPLWNNLFEQAYQLHYHGITKDQIEKFIQSIINRKEPGPTTRSERLDFFDKHMTIPYGRSASENIIDCILSSDNEF